jgi:EAL domain-containing protein (putative c-di-GMP-specific phosphodiesterase class I)/DNA-binding NarL/FixJ family response regulator
MPPDAKMTRIVLLDDDPFMLRLLVRMLAQIGYTQVLACDNGPKALQEVSTPTSAVDLVVLDINMPGMDGVEFIRQLVECKYGGSVALVSGENSRILESVEKLLHAHQLVSLGHLQKPVSLEDLKRLLEQLEPRNATRGRRALATQCYSAEELRVAIAHGDLVNHYQPQVTLTTGEFVGVESLVRWQHSEDGLIFPDRFISLAADHRLMPDLTRAVLGSAMKQVKAWSHAGHQVPVAVNVSMDDLTALDFPDVAAALAAAAGIDPCMVTLEVTEGQVMRQLSTALDVISRLRLKRFRLAIDDFGTGHSSLAQLRDLPFDELKVDRSFVHGASSDATLQAICSASLRMAQQLKLHVVAEGIEDQNDWNLLRDLGCDVAQGYFIARPMPAVALMEWIADWSVRRRHKIAPNA